MRKRPDARALLFEKIRSSPAKFAHITGAPYAIECKEEADPTFADLVILTIEVPPYGRILCNLNTISRRNRDEGFDPQVRLDVIQSNWSDKPVPSLMEEQGLDYAKVESVHRILYQAFERE